MKVMPWLVELRPKTRSEVIMASKEGGNVTFREHAAVANLSTNARKESEKVPQIGMVNRPFLIKLQDQ